MADKKHIIFGAHGRLANLILTMEPVNRTASFVLSICGHGHQHGCPLLSKQTMLQPCNGKIHRLENGFNVIYG